MKLRVTLSPDAVRAVVRSVSTGPNCQANDGLQSLLAIKRTVDLAQIAQYLENGPDTFLVWYAVSTQKRHLDALDISKAYCLHHIEMVRAANEVYRTKGLKDDYFKHLRSRGFAISPTDISGYFFSCCGKPAKVIRHKDNLAKVESGRATLEGVVIPPNFESPWVVVHFATAISEISQKDAENIQELQQNNPWFAGISRKVSKIDYKNFCGGDLTSYVLSKIHP